MAEEIKNVEQEQSKWKIDALGGDMMFIHDPNKKPGKNGKPFGWVISEKDALKHFAITKKVPMKVGNSMLEMPDPSVYSADDIELSNQVMAHIASRNNPNIDVPASAKPIVKVGRPKMAEDKKLGGMDYKKYKAQKMAEWRARQKEKARKAGK